VTAVRHVGKAITAAVVAFLGAWITGLEDAAMTQQEWLTATLAAVTALGAVWAIPNTPKAPDG
jgi:hypothetical protein